MLERKKLTIMIQITEKQIADSLKKEPIDYINLYTDAYLAEVDNELNAENMQKLNGHQHALLAYRFFREEVNYGGFVQLIQNGYGAYIFDNPTAKAFKIFGADATARLIYKAKEIYDANREELERDTTDEEFNAMYVDFEEFEQIEESFYQIEKKQTEIIALYVDMNRDMFAKIV